MESADCQWQIKTRNGTIYLTEPMETAACTGWQDQQVEIRKMSELQRMLLSKRGAGARQQISIPGQGETPSDSAVEREDGCASQEKRRATHDQ